VVVTVLVLGCTAAVGSEIEAAPVASAGWQFSGESEGVLTYLRSFPQSAYAQVRALGSVCASLGELSRYISDPDRLADWVPDTREARLLDSRSRDEQVYYVRTALPWPMKDRDMIYRLQAAPDPDHENEMVVSMDGIPDFAAAEEGVVRMTSASGHWHFRERAGRTDISLEMHIEPGGAVPAALARRRITSTPARMLGNLKRHFAEGCSER